MRDWVILMRETGGAWPFEEHNGPDWSMNTNQKPSTMTAWLSVVFIMAHTKELVTPCVWHYCLEGQRSWHY